MEYHLLIEKLLHDFELIRKLTETERAAVSPELAHSCSVHSGGYSSATLSRLKLMDLPMNRQRRPITLLHDRIWLCIICLEFGLIILLLSLFGSAFPGRIRTLLWTEGGAHGWNSDPKLRIYFYANYQEPPIVPYIWAWRSTATNLLTAVATCLLFIFHTVLSICYDIWPGANLCLWSCLSVLWCTCLCLQTSSDTSDPEHPSFNPWYLEHHCSAVDPKAQDACRMAQASFVASIMIFCLYTLKFVWAASKCLVDIHREKQRQFLEYYSHSPVQITFTDEEKQFLRSRGSSFDGSGPMVPEEDRCSV